jgi:hypothetical protein
VEPAPLTSVNSAFLCGLFADVAEAQSVDLVSCTSQDTNTNDCLERPLKRSCVSFSKSMVRTATTLNLAGQSDASPSASSTACPSILDLIDQAFSPTSTTEIIKVQNGHIVPLPQDLNPKTGPSSLKARDNTSSSPKGTETGPVFPQLPATVSATSCKSTLTRKVSDLQTSLAENTEKESYGWFVEMDEEYAHDTTTPVYESSSSPHDLAFQAPTAPKAANYDAELEWAKAADTVDDVLGDFF